MSEPNKISERRIRNNRIRRQRERRRNIVLFLLIVCFITSLTCSCFLSSAKEQGKETEHKYYTSIRIREGDTLWSIAETYMDDHYISAEDYIRELCRINSLTDTEIMTGMYLIVPYSDTCSEQTR